MDRATQERIDSLRRTLMHAAHVECRKRRALLQDVQNDLEEAREQLQELKRQRPVNTVALNRARHAVETCKEVIDEIRFGHLAPEDV